MNDEKEARISSNTAVHSNHYTKRAVSNTCHHPPVAPYSYIFLNLPYVSRANALFQATIASYIPALFYIKNQLDAALAVLFISHCKITLPLQWQPTSDILTGYTSSRPMACTSGCFYSC